MPLGLLAELQRRRVFRALVAYGIAAFAVLQIIEPLMHGLHWRDEVLSYVVVALAVGFPIVVSLAWIFDVNAERIERTAPVSTPVSSVVQNRFLLASVLVGIGLAAAAPGVIYFFFIRGRTAPPGAPSIAQQRTATDRATPDEGKSIAVLPFTDLSSARDQEYFSDGMTEELLDALSNVRGLRVAARTSSFAFKGKSDDIGEIARKLRVGTVLEGSVRKEGNRMRITAQLVNAVDGFHLWSKTYERDAKDVFAIQEEIARAIVTALQVPLGNAPIAQATTTNVEAHNLYLLGRSHFNRFTEADLRKSLEYYEEALAKDPRYVRAYTAAAASWGGLADDWIAPTEAEMQIRGSILKALEIDPFNPEAHAQQGTMLFWYNWDLRGAERELRRAIELLPSSPDPHGDLALLLVESGRADEALREADQEVTLDPLSLYAAEGRIDVLLAMDRIDEALSAARSLVATYPRSPVASWLLGNALLQARRTAEALAAYRQGAELDPAYARARAGEVRALAALGHPAEARRALRELEELARRRYVRPEEIAAGYASLGDRDQAFAWLDRAVTARSAGMMHLRGFHLYDPLRSDRRFVALEKRVGLR